MTNLSNKPDLSPKGPSINLQVGGYAVTRQGHIKKIKSSFKVGDHEVFVDESEFQYRSDGSESYDRNLESPNDFIAVCDKDGKIKPKLTSIFDIEIGGMVGDMHGHEIAYGDFKDWEVAHTFEVPKETFESMYANLNTGKPYMGKMGYIVSATEDVEGNASCLLIVYAYDGSYRIANLIAPQWKNII